MIVGVFRQLIALFPHDARVFLDHRPLGEVRYEQNGRQPTQSARDADRAILMGAESEEYPLSLSALLYLLRDISSKAILRTANRNGGDLQDVIHVTCEPGMPTAAGNGDGSDDEDKSPAIVQLISRNGSRRHRDTSKPDQPVIVAARNGHA